MKNRKKNHLKPEFNKLTPPAQEKHLIRELTPHDLIEYELCLKDSLSKFIKFEAYSLYFPAGKISPLPKWLPEENKLLLPLLYKEEMLGVFAASGVHIKPGQLDFLGGLTAVCLDNLALLKAGLIDSVSGLYTRECLLNHLAAAVEAAQGNLIPNKRDDESVAAALNLPAGISEPSVPELGNLLAGPAGNNFAVMSVNFSPLAKVSREYGYAFADKFVLALARSFKDSLPEQVLAAGVSDNSFAVYLPGRTYTDCIRLGREICARMADVQVAEPLTHGLVSLLAAVGFACYPQDMEAGGAFVRSRQSAAEQAQQILQKARYASARAWDSPRQTAGENGQDGERQIYLLGFREILAYGGRVVGSLPMARVELNLGMATGAREGMHFKVLDGEITRRSKFVGEIILSAVQENLSAAEVLGLSDPTRGIRTGDRLELMPDFGFDSSEERGVVAEYSEGADTASRLLSHRTFLSKFAVRREECSQFCLALVRIAMREPISSSGLLAQPDSADTSENDPRVEADLLSKALNSIMDEQADLFEGGAFAAKYGMHSLIIFFPDLSSGEIVERLKITAKNLENELGLELLAGVAAYPWLNYRKSDIMTNVGKALDFALLIDKPHVGEANSLALNIRADRHFSHGDMFEAIQEYKQALLADDNNVWAWISLGVCMAGIGNREEARRSFEAALDRSPKELTALYNLAQVMQADGDNAQARLNYERCLEISPEHAFAILRLGQMAENSGDLDEAKEYYLRAGEYPQGEAAAFRQLARMAVAENQPDKAREHLHRALARNSHDPLALAMLADIYLSQGDNPEIALSLARQSVALRPDYTLGWLGLAKAYEACGQAEQAERARLRAAEL